MSTTVPFRLLGGHLTLVPVTVDGLRPATFLLDTGMGLTVVSDRLRQELGHPLSGKQYTGRRMSGQAIPVPLTRLGSLAFGTKRLDRPVVGSYDLSGVTGLDGAVDGFLSLAFFDGLPLTIDYLQGVVIVEDDDSLGARERAGVSVPVEVRRDGPSVEVYLDLELPNGSVAHVEVDTGSDQLILHERYLAELGQPKEPQAAERREGIDETGRPYVRYRARLAGRIRVRGCARLEQEDPVAIFQQIIHDGLVGREFLRAFAVTYDLARGQLIFGPTG